MGEIFRYHTYSYKSKDPEIGNRTCRPRIDPEDETKSSSVQRYIVDEDRENDMIEERQEASSQCKRSQSGN